MSDPFKVQQELKRYGVIGLLILEESGIPLLIRDYDSRGLFNIINAELITGFIAAINNYALSFEGFLTDIGLGATRLALKHSRGHIFGLFVDERFLRRYQGEVFFMLIELTLKNLIRTFEIFLKLVEEEEGSFKGVYNIKELKKFRYQADLTLLDSFLVGAKYLDIQFFNI